MAADDIPGSKNQPRFLATGAPETAVDLNTIGDYAAKVGNRKVGTTAERNAATGKDVWEGLLWGDTSEGREYRRTGGSWVRFSHRTTGGSVSEPTNGIGTVTVNHSLGATPAWVSHIDTLGGSAPYTRKVMISAKNATQIQFVVGNNGAPMANNQVAFEWSAGI
jgi:hypothetical protein